MVEGTGEVLGRAFYAGDAEAVAEQILHKVLVHVDGTGGCRAGRIIEVEAYKGAEDPASHAYRGPTARNAAMFGPPGHLYVYFTYGMHWCANVVCGTEGKAQAVLLRALRPTCGERAMWAARPAARTERDLCNGPAKLCQALGIHGAHDGADLVVGDQGITLRDDGVAPPHRPGVGRRIGISAGTELPWRRWVPGEPSCSRPAP